MDGNRLLATSAPGVFSHGYAYNAQGSMTAMPHLAAIDWDHADRMRSADLGGGGTVHFLYDASGQRGRKVRENQAGSSTWERIYIARSERTRSAPHLGSASTSARFDRNDTALGTTWHAERMALTAGDPKRRAAELAEVHAAPPATTHLDALSRPFLHIDHSRDDVGTDAFAQTRVRLDVVAISSSSSRLSTPSTRSKDARLELATRDGVEQLGLAEVGARFQLEGSSDL